MLYNMWSHPIAFLATRHVVIKDLAFSSPLNDPPRRTNGIYEGVPNENYCLLEGEVEAKDYNTDIKKVRGLHAQYRS